MIAATRPRPAHRARLLVVDAARARWQDARLVDLPGHLAPGDLLVVNDAFTLPASVLGRVGDVDVELRLAEAPDGRGRAWAILFGPGTWRVATEDREPPPRLRTGDTIEVADTQIEVLAVHPAWPRLVRIRASGGMVWARGRPVQYRYLERELRLSEIQTPYATHPWAVEMPSAGRSLTLELLDRVRAVGVEVASLTHAAGLSSTGDPELDAALPLPERYRVPPATWDAVRTARRVVAVGTSVVRALESASDGALSGVTELRIGPGYRPRVIDGLLSGMHSPGESHFSLLEAFAPRDLLLRTCRHAGEMAYRNHEFGDVTLLWADRPR